MGDCLKYYSKSNEEEMKAEPHCYIYGSLYDNNTIKQREILKRVFLVCDTECMYDPKI